MRAIKYEFLQLAEHYKPGKSTTNGWFISEKLDGTRCFWDGGLSRGMKTEDVPWANITDPKTGKKKVKIKPRATGLWSRYGNPIIAPDAFLNLLPCCPLDGELWAGRGNFQLCRSICGGDTPDPRFMDKIVYAVYSAPPPSAVFMTREISNANMVRGIDYLAIERWIGERVAEKELDDYCYLPPGVVFSDEVRFLAEKLDVLSSKCYLHPQIKLPNTDDCTQHIEDFLQRVLDKGGEGVVIRNPLESWIPRRHHGILKYKPFDDAESVLTGFTSGRETEKGSRLLGMIGALITDFNGKRLELAGLTDVERGFQTAEMSAYAKDHPDEDMPATFQGRCFKVGQKITFKYRELSDDGVPKEARYWRRRDEE